MSQAERDPLCLPSYHKPRGQPRPNLGQFWGSKTSVLRQQISVRCETRYYHVEKAILALVHTTRKLSHYFQAHIVVFVTQLPLLAVLGKLDYSIKVVQWRTMLGAFDIKYQSRTSIKGQVLADLVAEFLEDQTKEGVQSQEAVGVFVAEISPP